MLKLFLTLLGWVIICQLNYSSKELNRLGFKSSMGKDFYPSLVSVIWKKIEKKQRILNQPVVTEYSDFDIQMIQIQN